MKRRELITLLGGAAVAASGARAVETIYSKNCLLNTTQLLTGRANMAGQVNKQEIAMSKTQKGNREKKKPKTDKNQPKTHVTAYKAAQSQGKPSFFNPLARKT
jgi:hypothetical protein